MSIPKGAEAVMCGIFYKKGMLNFLYKYCPDRQEWIKSDNPEAYNTIFNGTKSADCRLLLGAKR